MFKKIWKLLTNKEYRYFVKKYKEVQFTIWDLQFKRYKTKEVREEIRQLMDSRKAAIENLKERVKAEEKEGKIDKEDLETMKDDIVRGEKEQEKFQEQLNGLDAEVNGIKPSQDYPGGVTGIEDQLSSLHELREMLKVYMEKL